MSLWSRRGSGQPQGNEPGRVPAFPGLLLSGAVIACCNIASVLIAFTLWILIRTEHQVAFQAPLAVVLSIAGTVVWLRRWSPLLRTQRGTLFAYAISVLLALPLGAVIFVGAHWIGRGHFSGLGNLVALWLFQLATNPPAVLLALWMDKE